MQDIVDEYNRALELLRQGRVDESLLTLTELPRINQGIERTPQYCHTMAVIAFRRGQVKLAQEYYLKAYSANPRDTDTIGDLAEAYRVTGDLMMAGFFLMKKQRMEQYRDREDVYVIGDSHADFLFTGIPRCKVQWESRTMHVIGRDGVPQIDELADKPPGSVKLVYVFGEIDIRCHVVKQRESGRDMDEILATLCCAYLERILNTPHGRAARGDNVVVSVMAPTTCTNNAAMPFHGSIAERVHATRRLNDMLRTMAVANGLQYLDVHRYFADPAGVLMRGLSDNLVHVRREFSDIVEYELEKLLASPR